MTGILTVIIAGLAIVALGVMVARSDPSE